MMSLSGALKRGCTHYIVLIVHFSLLTSFFTTQVTSKQIEIIIMQTDRSSIKLHGCEFSNENKSKTHKIIKLWNLCSKIILLSNPVRCGLAFHLSLVHCNPHTRFSLHFHKSDFNSLLPNIEIVCFFSYFSCLFPFK